MQDQISMYNEYLNNEAGRWEVTGRQRDHVRGRRGELARCRVPALVRGMYEVRGTWGP